MFFLRYEIIDKVGSGGMADVYKAKNLDDGSTVAIKILKKEYIQLFQLVHYI